MFMPLTRTSSFPSFLIGGGKDRGAMIDSLIWRNHGTIHLAGIAEF
jgi:hypothetical protein